MLEINESQNIYFSFWIKEEHVCYIFCGIYIYNIWINY